MHKSLHLYFLHFIRKILSLMLRQHNNLLIVVNVLGKQELGRWLSNQLQVLFLSKFHNCTEVVCKWESTQILLVPVPSYHELFSENSIEFVNFWELSIWILQIFINFKKEIHATMTVYLQLYNKKLYTKNRKNVHFDNWFFKYCGNIY